MSLFKPLRPSGRHVYHKVKNKNFAFCPHSVFRSFLCLWEKVAFISLYSIKWSNYITKIGSVYCAVRTGSVYKIHIIIIIIIKNKSDFCHAVIFQKKVMCRHSHVCVCVCIYICVCVCVCIYTHTYIYLYVLLFHLLILFWLNCAMQTSTDFN